MNEEMGSAKILKTGPGTSIQDLGRTNGSKFGIPSSGVMDQKSVIWINHVLQNNLGEAVLEVSQPGLKIQFDAPTFLSLAGARAKVMVNQIEITNPSLIPIQKGDVLEMGQFSKGSRVYIGVKSGFQTETILDSRSQFGPVTFQSMVKTGDLVPFKRLNLEDFAIRGAKPRWNTNWFEKEEIKVYPGPDWNLLNPEQQTTIKKKVFHLSKLSNRMGIQLEELIENKLPELPTNPVFPGTVQLTPGGKLLVLMRDAGVTGGYLRILQLSEHAISQLSQKSAGSQIRFVLNEF